LYITIAGCLVILSYCTLLYLRPGPTLSAQQNYVTMYWWHNTSEIVFLYILCFLCDELFGKIGLPRRRIAIPSDISQTKPNGK